MKEEMRMTCRRMFRIIVLISSLKGAIATQVLADSIAGNPSPADGAVSAPELSTAGPYMFLQFTAGADAVSHTCYFSDSYSDVAERDSAHSLGSPPYPEYFPTAYYVGIDDPEVPPFARAPLERGKTYFWCVDEFDGQTTWPGDVWAFTVMTQKAWNPDPLDRSAGVEPYQPVTLTWQRGDVHHEYPYDVHYEIYFGTDVNRVRTSTTPNAEVTNESKKAYGIVTATTYFWRVDTVQTLEAPPYEVKTFKGDVWSFRACKTTIYVDDDATGANDGSSWANAYNYLHDALAFAENKIGLVEIRVAGGTYKPDEAAAHPDGTGDRDLSFELPVDTILRGGYAGWDAPEPNHRNFQWHETVLSGDIGIVDQTSDNSYHVVTSFGPGPASSMDGFTIKHGRSSTTHSPSRDSGGGVYTSHSSITFSNCIIEENTGCFGGGMHNSESSVVLTNCIFRNNHAGGYGGAAYNRRGNQIYKACRFIANTSESNAGALTSYSSNATFYSCVFARNRSITGRGGVMNNASATVTLHNCTLVDNYAHLLGGAIHNDNVSIRIVNSILWANSDGYNRGPHIFGGRLHIDYSCIEESVQSFEGIGNIADDPCFVSPEDYHLQADSPCINAGDPAFVAEPNSTDIDGEKRLALGRVDMGADEWQPAVIYVDSRADGENDGSSWPNAYKYLQDALADANAAPKPIEIRVAQGTYKPDQTTLHPNGSRDRRAAFQLINGVALKGGYAGLGSPDLNDRNIDLYETLLSGDLNGNDGPHFANNTDNTYHVFHHPEGLNLDDTAIIDGFIITAGNADLRGWPHGLGGGMFNYQSSPTVDYCTFTANSAHEAGGGMCNDESSPAVNSCTFTANSTERAGGGMYNVQSSPIVNNSIFRANRSTVWGGAMNNYKSSPNVDNCAFSENAAFYGAGMYNSEGSPIINNCTFTANSAHIAGGAMCNDESSPTVNSCTFTGNSADTIGGGMYNSRRASLTVTGSTIMNNNAPNGPAVACDYFVQSRPSTVTIRNCIIWNGIDWLYKTEDSSITIFYSDVEAGWPGLGNLNADPRFVDPGYWDPNGTPADANDDFWVEGDYRLSSNSPCINAGDPNFVPGPNDVDMDGENRVMLGRVDMGADEFNPFSAEFVVVRKQRVDRTVFEYECHVLLQNISESALENVALQLSGWSPNMTIVDPDVGFDDTEIPAGQSATSVDTCTFTVSRFESIDPAAITWNVTAELADTGAKMHHTVSTALPPQAPDFETLKTLTRKWLWQGPPGGSTLDAVPDGKVNLADFAKLAQDWIQE